MLLTASYNLKIADFGFASLQKEGLTQYIGTPVYAAPEILKQQPYGGTAVDVFSIGVVLFVMLTGRYPFKWAHEQDESYKPLSEGKYEKFWTIFEKMSKMELSAEVKQLLNRMFCMDSKERIHLEEILEDKWMKSFEELTGEDVKNRLVGLKKEKV